MRSKLSAFVGISILLLFVIAFLVGIGIILELFLSEIFRVITDEFFYWFEFVFILIIGWKNKIAGNYVVLVFFTFALFGVLAQPINLDISNILLRISLVGMVAGLIKYIANHIIEIKNG